MADEVKIVHVYGQKIWCEHDLMGDKHVVIQSEAPDAKPFTWCTFGYNYRYTDNATQRRNAEDMARMLGASDPIEWRCRPIKAIEAQPEESP